MFWLVFLVAVVVGVLVVRRSIREVEGVDRHPVERTGFSDRWSRTTGMERAAFIVMALSMIVWIGLILFIPVAVAMGAVGWMIWGRPYLARPLGQVVLWSGIAAAISLNVPFRGDEGIGATVTGVILVHVPWIVVGLLLLRTGVSEPSQVD